MKVTLFSGVLGLLLLFVVSSGQSQQTVLTDPVVITPNNAVHLEMRFRYRAADDMLTELYWSSDGSGLLAYNPQVSDIHTWSLTDEQIRATVFSVVGNDDVPSRLMTARWHSNQQIVVETWDYPNVTFGMYDASTGEYVRYIFHGDYAYKYIAWNADYTRYLRYDFETDRLIEGSFDGDPVSVSWDIELLRYTARDDRLLPEQAVPGTLERGGMLRYDDGFQIEIDDQWYRINLDTGEKTPVSSEPEVEVMRWQSKQFDPEIYGYRDDETLTYDLTLSHPEAGDEITTVENLPFPATRDEGGWPYVAQSIHPDDSLAAVAVAGGVNIWSLETGELLNTLETDSDLASLDWNPQGTMLAAGTLDGRVYFFSVTE